ncbi:methionine adenosyltransferase [Ruminococcus sp.]|uniref:methionine adenosyltransferase n=1 Tax=Ruminococcus sp. TaxID=41978 RepID=UPI00388E3BA4
MMSYLFTSESVTEGHPDKVCDRISDSILDAILKQDPNAHVACETTATTGRINIMGEVSTTAKVDYEAIARQAVCDIGYDSERATFDGNTCEVNVFLDTQSPDIAMGVNASYELRDGEDAADNLLGAGDQGMMFGYACDETPELMPLAISLSQKLAKRLTEVRKNGTLPYLRPDGKTQVTVEYEGDTARRVDTVVVSTQHDEDVSLDTIREDMLREVIRPVIPEGFIDGDTKIFVNPTGRFVIGGPQGDAGLTGRKIIVDTYGGYARHGGGAFSGKDPTKVDRSAAYYARYIAKNIVAAGIAKKAEVQLAYAIGVAKPVSVMVDTFGTSAYSDEKIAEAVKTVFDARPSSIIRELDLLHTTYAPLAAYGHMGREELGVRWEKTDKAEALLAALQ